MSQPKVSIVIPVYNDAPHIGAAIGTAMAQTERNIEIIVVDDCSTDQTPVLVQKFVARDQRVRYVRMNTNSGPSACRNRGIDLAQGEWIALLDSDDRYDRTRLTNLIDLARRESADMVSDNLLLCPVADEPERVMIPPSVLSAPRQMSFLEFMHGCMWSKKLKRSAYVFMKPMIRREFLQQTGVRYDPSSRNGEDFLFYIDCFMVGAKWFITPDATYFYTVHDISLTDRVGVEDRRLMTAKLEAALAHRIMRHDPALTAITRKHWRITASDYYFRGFKAAVRAHDVRAAVAILTHSKMAPAYLTARLARRVPAFVAKRIGLVAAPERKDVAQSVVAR